MDYEAALISRIIIEEKSKEVMDLNLHDDLFTTCFEEWRYVKDFYRQHGSSPPPEHFEHRFPEFEIKGTTAPFSHLAEELQDRRAYNLVANAMKEAAPLLKAKRPRAALEIYRKMVLNCEDQTRTSNDINVVENAIQRLEDYHRIVEAGGITGVTTPWPLLDATTMGFQPEELWMVVARGGCGKTWCEVIASRYEWASGYRPLLFTREMSVEQIVKRFDSAHAGVAHARLRSGQLTHEEYEKYKETLRLMEGAPPFWISGDDGASSGISGIISKIDKYRPNIVWIDGMYLVEDERGGRSVWEKMKNIATDLKGAARSKKIPIVVSHQFNQEGKDDKGTADTLAYGDVQKWFDGIIGMYQTEDLRVNKEMLFKLLKHREGEKLEFVSQWDLENMMFDVKGVESEDVEVSNEELQEEAINF